MRKFLIATALLLVALPVFSADLYITEFGYSSGGVTYQAVKAPPVASQKVAISGSSSQSNAFNASTVIIRVNAEATCSVQIGGASPTATTTSARMIAGQTEYFIVTPGDKLAVITNN